MPFLRANFGPLGGQSKAGSGAETAPGAPQMWAYRTADAAGTVDTSGYFNEVAGLLNVGDLIWRVTVDAAGSVTAAGWHVVLSKTVAGVVDVSDTTAATITNAD